MRIFALPLVLWLISGAGCAATDAPAPVFIDAFLEVAHTVECTPLDSPTRRGAMISEVTVVDDSTFMAVYPERREVVVYGPTLREQQVISFEADGLPDMVEPGGAAFVGDSLLFVADKGANQLRRVDLAGNDRGTLLLDFAPDGVYTVGDGLLVTPFVIGRHPRWSVYDLAGDDASPRRIPTIRHTDPLINMLANTTVSAVYPDGHIIVGHRYIVPFAHVMASDPQAPVERVSVPLPPGVRNSLNDLPELPYTGDEPERIPTVMIDAAPDLPAGDLLYIVRTGRRSNDDYFEKAIVRVDRDLAFRRAYLPGINAIRLAYLSDRSISVIADEEDRWYTCPTP